VAARLRAIVQAEPGTETARVLDIRVPDLIDYHNQRYARAYAEFVEQVRKLEGGSTVVTAAVARNLYKLMAYKDEYEVARLSLDKSLLADIEARFGVGSHYSYRLHPPVFRALGLKRKISLGPWFRPAFQVLRMMRRVRGSRLDLFGYARVRRVERELIDEYRDTVMRALSGAPVDHPAVLELAELPDMVRGYEDIKLTNVAAYRRRQAELLAELSLSPSEAGLVGA
jgi:indolepyruvate ferredoxin oxidoreductase